MAKKPQPFADAYPRLDEQDIKKLLANKKSYAALVAYANLQRTASSGQAAALNVLWGCVTHYVGASGYSARETQAAYEIIMGFVAPPE